MQSAHPSSSLTRCNFNFHHRLRSRYWAPRPVPRPVRAIDVRLSLLVSLPSVPPMYVKILSLAWDRVASERARRVGSSRRPPVGCQPPARSRLGSPVVLPYWDSCCHLSLQQIHSQSPDDSVAKACCRPGLILQTLVQRLDVGPRAQSIARIFKLSLFVREITLKAALEVF
jgi:hypothetical protein